MPIRRLALAASLLAGLAGPLFAQSADLPIARMSGPQEVANMNQKFNTLINSLNAILVPVFAPPSSGSAAVNQISITGGATGDPAVIGLQSGADTTGGIRINPASGGDIVLFTGGSASSGALSTGVLKFANAASFVAANGIDRCPGMPATNPLLGTSGSVTGYIMIKDWLNRSHGMPVC